MYRIGGDGRSARPLSEIVERLEIEHGSGNVHLVFRTMIASDLVSRRSVDLDRIIGVVPNRIENINFWSETDAPETFNQKCIGYTPWYPPDDAVQLFVGGPKYANDYNSARTKRVSSFKDLANKFGIFL
jgi:hypothetical protein